MNMSIGDDLDSSSPINSDDFLLAITNLLYNIYMPICCIIGLTGNCMVWILIRSNRILKKLPSNMYLLALSLVSSVFLLSLFIFWIEQITHTKIYSQYTITCKLVSFRVETIYPDMTPSVQSISHTTRLKICLNKQRIIP
jgi:type III secretory pathway component EscR